MTSAQAPAEDDLRLGVAVRTPSIKVDGTELATEVNSLLIKVVVDSHLHLPDMFELTILDQAGKAVDQGHFKLGAKVEVRALGEGSTEISLMTGEVTSIEGRYSEYTWFTVIRGYSDDHRLQRARRSRAFLDKTDSEVAKQLAEEAGLTIGTVEATTVKHPLLAQADQSDWAFLVQRAKEIGYEVGAAAGKFYFRKASSLTGGTALPAAFGQGLVTFNPRVSAASLVTEVEARAQDTAEAKAIGAKKPVTSPSAEVSLTDPATAGGGFDPKGAPPSSATAENGPAPTPKGYVVNRGFSIAASSDQALQDTATALAAHVGSSFAEAEGELMGDARVVAGAVLQVDGVPQQFCGKWLVTTARHVFDNNDRGYRVRFTVSGRHDRSLLALTSGRGGRGAGGGGGSGLDGVVVGIVNDINDPLKLGRVKVILPWLAPDYITGWAPVAQLFAGANGGALFLPDVKEQVLVAFEQGDLRRPYVLGSVLNNRTGGGVKLDGSSAKPGEAAVGGGSPAAVVRRGIVSPFGSQLVFHEEGPPSGGNPTAAEVTLGAGKDKITILMDAVGGTLSIKCVSGQQSGAITIESDGNIDIKAGSAGNLTIDGGANLTLKGKAVNIEGTGAVAVKGKPIQLN
jgi:phage protein D